MNHPLLNRAFAILFTCFSTLGFAQNALDFDGVDDKIDCGNDTSLQITGKLLTLEAWIYPTAWKTNVFDGNIICKEYNTSNYGYMLRCGAGGKLNFAIGDGTWREITTANTVLSLNVWQHVAGTYDGAKMRLYLNGAAIDSLTIAINIASSNTTPLMIGAHSSYTRFYQGLIDEVRVWKACRTVSEINSNMNGEFCGKVNSNLRLYYKLNQGKASGNNSTVKTAIDYSQYYNHGTVTAFSLSGTSSNWLKGKTLKKQVVNGTDNIIACDRYTSPSGKYRWTASGTYNDTIPSYQTCDSAIKITLKIKKSTSKTLTAQACKTYTSPSGTYTWTKSGTYIDYLVNSVQCDSVLTIILKIGGSRDTIFPVVCRNYKVPSGKRVLSAPGDYYDTLVNYRGCDSVILINLDILSPTYGSLDKKVCKSFTSPSGKYIYTQNGNYQDTLVNSQGCDSIVLISITINTSKITVKKTICNVFKSPSGKYTYTQSGTYKDTLKNYAGCDSIITFNLTVNKTSFATQNISACKKYTSPYGKKKTYFASGTFNDTIANKGGCDSVITTNLTIINLNRNIVKSGTTLSAVKTGAQYQWLNCDLQKAKISGENKINYIPAKTGNYAVEISDSGCTDTSTCLAVTIVSAIKNYHNLNITISPNPSKGEFEISLPKLIKEAKIIVIDANGKQVFVQYYSELYKNKLNLNLSNGWYLVHIKSAEFEATGKLIVEN